MCLIVVLLLGFGVSNLLLQAFVEKSWLRLALAATIPLYMLFSVFFAIVIFSDLFQALGPIKTLKRNSRFYSAIRPDISVAYAQGFKPPRITIQMPVYTESLNGVIIPTVTSLKAAISHYESHGGNILIRPPDNASTDHSAIQGLRPFSSTMTVSTTSLRRSRKSASISTMTTASVGWRDPKTMTMGISARGNSRRRRI